MEEYLWVFLCANEYPHSVHPRRCLEWEQKWNAVLINLNRAYPENTNLETFVPKIL